MATVVAHTKIKRDFKKYIYYVKEGGVWQAPRRGSKGGGKKKMIKKWGTKSDMDYSRFIYFLDKHGNVAAAPRKHSRGGARRAPRKVSASRARYGSRGRRMSAGGRARGC